MKTIIHASIMPNRGAGGVETVLIALVSALGKLTGPDEFIVVCDPAAGDWLKPFVGSNTQIACSPKSSTKQKTPKTLRAILSPVKRFFSPSPIEWNFPAVSNGFLESLGAQAIHFPCQDFVICGIPSVYSPHDLQHRHFPQFFSAQSLVWREETYRKGCDYSKTVVVGSRFVKEDIVTQFGCSASKIQVIPLAPPLQAYAAPSPERVVEVKKKYDLARPFLLYPAMTWPHKNHVRLIDGLLRSQTALDLVCTGFKNHYWPEIEAHLGKVNASHRIKFLGLVPGEDLRAIYQMSQFVIIPTLFESTSEPIFEAWDAGKGVACSNVSALPEQTAGAALLFDPYRVESIAQAIDQMAAEAERFAALGKQRLKDFGWDITARAYRAVYRRCAGEILTNEDEYLLETDWMQCKAA